MTELSPAAKAVLDAIEIKYPRDILPVIDAIRAAADNLVFSDQLGLTAYGGFCQLQDQLHAIADELDGDNV